MTIGLLIAVTKAMSVIFDERRGYGWIAEVRVAAGIRRRSLCNVTPCCLKTIMVTLLGDLRKSWWWWWRWVVWSRLGMRTSGEGKGKYE